MKRKKFKKRYGFPPEDLWSLDVWLARELSKRMLVWVEIGPHTHPMNRTHDGWVTELKYNAEALHNYALDADKYFDEGLLAMRWVAVNFPQLWD